ncbi:hypothetical protein [Glycomyces arizonensis]|uniref:hypothetical protein n=1 Tax=Glycomyces arizonensis TaxID=256035 RepID=UPI000408B220|nr:hypothetical protein [Glycomyces arizonensis]
MHRIRTLRGVLVVALTALPAFDTHNSALQYRKSVAGLATSPSDASGRTDWATRHTSSMECYADPPLDHARLLDDVVAVFAPRYGGSGIAVLDWATGAVGDGGRATDVVNRGSD